MNTELSIDNPTIINNLSYYYLARCKYTRFHYSDVYSYARNMIRLDEEKAPIIKEMDEMYKHPLLTIAVNLIGIKTRFGISLPRLEYVAWRDTQFPYKLDKMYYMGKTDLELGQIIDILDFFKKEIHDKLMDFLVEHQIPTAPMLSEDLLRSIESPESAELWKLRSKPTR